MTFFLVQYSAWADWISRHDTEDEAAAKMRNLLLTDDGLRLDDLNIREIDSDGKTVRVFRPEQ